MGTADQLDGQVFVHVKGAPEEVLPRCAGLDDAHRAAALAVVNDMAGRGLRVLAVARRGWTGPRLPERDEAESELTLLGLVGLIDPPRPEVDAAVTACHTAGIRIHVVTGDNGRTAAEIARGVGIGADRVVDGLALDVMSDDELDALLRSGDEVVFARAAPEAKLRISDALRHEGEVVAMTGDGVNDAPALRRADIGVAMGRGVTDVAREAATLVLTDDNFATIVTGVEEGRRVFDNVRKFVLYIFAHAVPEVLQILAIDLGTETLPALALGREPAEPGLMTRPPRRRDEGVITWRRLLLRAWESWAWCPRCWCSARSSPCCSPRAGDREPTPRRAARCTMPTCRPPRPPSPAPRRCPAGLALLLPFPVVVWGADELYRWIGRRGRTPDPGTVSSPRVPAG